MNVLKTTRPHLWGILIIICLVSYGQIGFAIIIETATNGNWNNTSTWVGGTIPSNGDSILINHNISLDVNFHLSNSGWFKISSGASINGNKDIDLKDSGEMRNDGTLAIRTFKIKDDVTATLNGMIIIADNFDIQDNAVVNGNATISVVKDLTIMDNAQVTFDGFLKIGQNLVIQSGAQLVLNNMVKVAGEFDNSSNEMFINGDLYTYDFTNKAGGVIKGYGTINATGTFTNNGTIKGTNVGGNQWILPIEMVSFRVWQNDRYQVYLEWITASERDNERFIVERSFDGIEFHSIGWLRGAGTSSTQTEYTFIDHEPEPGQRSFYRLKQVDTNGKTTFSKMVTIKVKESPLAKEVFEVYPNPVISKQLYLEVAHTTTADQELPYMIFDLSGKTVMTGMLTQGGNGKFVSHLDLKGRLDPGIYSITVETSRQLHSKKIVIK